MKLLKYGVIALVALVLLGIGAFAFLGMQSRGGAALGLVAAALHFPINDKPIDRSAMQAPAAA